jgi:glucosylceramidase
MISIIKKKFFLLSFALLTFGLGVQCQDNSPQHNAPPPVTKIDALFYLTNSDQSILFEKQETGFSAASDFDLPTLVVDKNKTYQEMDGFGFTLTGGSALHLNNMTATKRTKLLTELFAFDNKNIGISYIRISLGASDLDENVFSYNDLPEGETDVNLERFSLDPDRKYLIPVLKEILTINPQIKIMASPWSPPVWMKTNGASKGGSLKPEYYNVYANYFVKYILEMGEEGITIDAITVQNEPLHPGNNPSLLMLAADQAEFIKTSLGPAFEKANIATKIIIYDHNADRTDYPIEILDDPDAKKYIDGSAFHLYGGSINDLSLVHKMHPDKNLYFTEQWIGAPGSFTDDLKWHMQNIVIGASRNWCKTVLEWNIAANSTQDPHTDGGCYQYLGAITIDGDVVLRNPAYYIIAHASKFVRPGSVRIDSNLPNNLLNVSFKTPDGKIVVLVINETSEVKYFNIKVDEKNITTSLNGGSVGTFIF